MSHFRHKLHLVDFAMMWMKNLKMRNGLRAALVCAALLTLPAGSSSGSAVPDIRPREECKAEIGSGTASWYGPGFHGRKTANGERYDMNALTAAHRKLPLGSRIMVENKANGQSLIVRINDRGPYIKGRVLDLSYKAAKELGFYEKGLTGVIIHLCSES